MTNSAATKSQDTTNVILCVLTAAVLVWSGIGPADRLTWWLEVAPVIIAVPILVLLYPKVRFSGLFYSAVFLHGIILMVGGHYTYAEVPFGFWMQETFDFSRNHYDRIGHLAQGFFPAIFAREILIRWSPLKGSKWLPFLVISFCLAFSAFYELLEWWSAVILGESSTDFLGSQGDVWDAQWDMFWALIGATSCMILLSRLHDRSLQRIIVA